MQDVNRAFDFLMDSQSGDSSYDHRDPDSGQENFRPEDVLNRELEPFPKKHAWWAPGKNLAVNVTLMGGVNLWHFSIIPQFYRDIHRPARNGKPEGIVIDPGWHSTDNHTISNPTPDIMYRCCKAAKEAESVGEAVKRQLKAIETKFSIQIPAAVESKLVKEADKVAKRRWGVDRLRARKILVPFDGSKAIELGYEQLTEDLIKPS